MNIFHHVEIEAPVKSVQKALCLLDMIIEADLSGRSATLGELAQEAGMPSNSAHNLLKTLSACGYVQQRVRGCYEPGPKYRQWGRVGRLQSPQMRPAILDMLKLFVRAEQESCVLVSLANGERVVLAHIDSEQAVRVSHATLGAEPFFSMPTGRMLAAIADEAELAQILRRHGLPGTHWDNIDTEQTLRDALEALRREGVCTIVSADKGMAAMAVGVCTDDDRAGCVLGAYAPLFRCGDDRRETLIEAMQNTAEALGAILSQPQQPDKQ